MAATSNLLETLELLQSRPLLTGRELAERLGVDRRTVRRYVTTLQSLGIPVEGERGVGGGYRLRPGYRLPPLMLSETEAVAMAVGLGSAERIGLEDAAAALDKVRRVLPDALRRRVEALDVVAYSGGAEGAPPAGATVLELAEAVRRGRRARFRHRARSRDVSPHGLVVHAGQWYLVAHDHERAATRTFRVDRIDRVRLQRAAATPPPEDFDAVAAVRAALARAPWAHAVDVRLDLALEDAQDRLRHIPAELTRDGDGTRARLRVESLDWMAGVLAGAGCSFTIREPDALRGHVRALAERLLESSSGRTSRSST